MITRAEVEEQNWQGEAEQGYWDFHEDLNKRIWFAHSWYYVKPKKANPMAYDATQSDLVREMIRNGGRLVEKVLMYKDEDDWTKHDGTIYYLDKDNEEDDTRDEVGDFFIKETEHGIAHLVFQQAFDDIPRESQPEIWCCAVETTPGGLVSIPAAIAYFIGLH